MLRSGMLPLDAQFWYRKSINSAQLKTKMNQGLMSKQLSVRLVIILIFINNFTLRLLIASHELPVSASSAADVIRLIELCIPK